MAYKHMVQASALFISFYKRMGRFWPDALYSLRSMMRKIDSCQRTRYSRDVFRDADGAMEGGAEPDSTNNR